MPTFIKTGFWEKVAKGYKGWLNLDDLISSIASTSSASSNFPTTQKETEVFNDVTLAGIDIPSSTSIYSTSLLFPNLTNVIDRIFISPGNSDNFQLLDFPNLETVNGRFYINTSSLRVLNVPKLSFVKNGFLFYDNSVISALTFSSLITLGDDPYGNAFRMQSCSDILTINLSNLTTAIGLFQIDDSSSLTTLNTSSLESVQGSIEIINCPNLNTIDLSNLNTFSPPTAATFDVSNNGLTETCINALLAKLLEIATPNITVDWIIKMEGGTNDAPSGQGILDVATLESKGCTVTTN